MICLVLWSSVLVPVLNVFINAQEKDMEIKWLMSMKHCVGDKGQKK